MKSPCFRSIVSLTFSAIALASGMASAADVSKGKLLYEKCAACHTFEVGKNEVGPHLAKIMGRKAAAVEEFRYSVALRRSTIVWDEATIDAYLADPQGYIKGNRMPFSGFSEKSDRDDVIAYIKQASK